MLKYAFGALLSSLTLSDIIEYQMKSHDTVIYPPTDTVSIIVPSLNEGKYIGKCLKSLREQEIIKQYPEYFEIMLVDSGSKDNTVELAKPYVDKILISPKGKLTARNLGIDQAKGNIIVSVDADAIYPEYWLNVLLKPFNDANSSDYDPSTVGVVGSTFDNVPGVPNFIANIAHFVDRKLLNPSQMVGRNSAFYKHSFYLSGKFDESINQIDVNEMLIEEEIKFGLRLSKLGKIIYMSNAPCIHLGGERIGCRFGIVSKTTCDQYGISIERFG